TDQFRLGPAAGEDRVPRVGVSLSVALEQLLPGIAPSAPATDGVGPGDLVTRFRLRVGCWSIRRRPGPLTTTAVRAVLVQQAAQPLVGAVDVARQLVPPAGEIRQSVLGGGVLLLGSGQRRVCGPDRLLGPRLLESEWLQLLLLGQECLVPTAQLLLVGSVGGQFLGGGPGGLERGGGVLASTARGLPGLLGGLGGR